MYPRFQDNKFLVFIKKKRRLLLSSKIRALSRRFLSYLQTKKKTHVYYYSYVRHGGGRRAFDEMDGHAWLNEINGRPRALTFTFRDGILTNTRLYYSMWTTSRRYYGTVKQLGLFRAPFNEERVCFERVSATRSFVRLILELQKEGSKGRIRLFNYTKKRVFHSS